MKGKGWWPKSVSLWLVKETWPRAPDASATLREGNGSGQRRPRDAGREAGGPGPETFFFFFNFKGQHDPGSLEAREHV